MSEQTHHIRQAQKSIYAERGDVFVTYAGERRIPRPLTAPPFRSEIFLGRDEDLGRIRRQLFSGDNLLLLVNGVGGMGKTTLAAHYYHRHQHEYAHTAWVLSERSIADALLRLAPPLGVQFEPTWPSAERVQVLLAAMAALDRPCLLVIDNANELPDLEANYQHLRRCSNFHLLLTTRITEFEQAAQCRIEGLSEDDALDLFRKHYPKHRPDEDGLVRQIRTAVGGNTLVLELLAKNLRQLHGVRAHYTLATLLADLQSRGLLALSQSKSVLTDYQSRDGLMRHERPEDIIAAMYDLGELSAAETALLSVFAALPPESIPFDLLETLLPDTPDLEQNLLALAQKGWIEYTDEDTSFKCSPVVQAIAQQKNPQLRSDCGPMLDVLVKKLKYQPGIGHLLNASYEDAAVLVRNTAAVLACFEKKPDKPLSILCERVGNYHQATGDLSRAFFFFEKNIHIREALCASDPDNADFKNGLAISYQNLGHIHAALGDLEQTRGFYEEYNRLAAALYAAYPTNMAFKNSLAISCQHLGNTHVALGDLERARVFYEQDLQLTKELCAAYPTNMAFKNGLAVSCQNLGNTHAALGDLEQARGFYEQDLQLIKELYAAYPTNVAFKNGLAVSYSKLGNTHAALGDLERAQSFYEESNLLIKELYTAYPTNVAFKNGLAISCQNLGETHAALSDLEQARGFYEEYNRLKKELCAAYPTNVAFKNGLAVSCSKLGNIHAALGDLEKALGFYEEYNRLEAALYTAYPTNVEFKNSLAISYAKLGEFSRDYEQDQAQARAYFQQAEALWSELVRDAPQVAKFRKFLGIVQGVLANL